MARTIFHVDMDAFYASVEQRDEPSFRGKPVIVGSDPQGGQGRGVVAACSYEARRFGVHSAMAISQAYRLCPKAVFLRPDFGKYTPASRAIRDVFQRFTERVEPLSIDEAFLDMTEKVADAAQALEIATRLKREIFQDQRLTASIGIAPNKMVSKIASDVKKPNGLYLVREEEVQSFLDPLKVGRIWGVGPKTQERLSQMGIETIAQLRTLEAKALEGCLGKFGRQLWFLARGQDDRPVVTERETKSISQETTFLEDVANGALLEETLRKQSLQVAERLHKHGFAARTITLKLRYSDFTTLTRQVSRRLPTRDAREIAEAALRLLRRHREGTRLIRLIGVGVSGLANSEERPKQLRLF